jgi:hypothetical protein
MAQDFLTRRREDAKVLMFAMLFFATFAASRENWMRARQLFGSSWFS